MAAEIKMTAHKRHAASAHPIGSLSCMRQAVARG